MPRTAIIGAGPAGCAAAHRLAHHPRQRRDVVLFDRAEAVGGRTASWRDGPRVVDSGAGFFTNFYPALASLLPTLGLGEQVVPLARSNSLVHDGRVVDFTLGSVRSFARFPFVSAGAKARMVAHTALAMVRHRGLELARPATLEALDDLSVEEDAKARLGEEAYEFLVRPGIEPFWYFACGDVSRSLALALQARAATARFFTFRDGMDVVCRRLVEGVPTRTGPAGDVQAIARENGQFVVRTAAGDTRVDEVVVATTGTVASRLVEGLDDTWVPGDVRAFLASQAYVPNVHAAFLVPAAACPPGVSAMFPCGPGRSPIAALSWNRFKTQGSTGPEEPRDVLSVFLSAPESRARRGDAERALFAHAWSLARAFCPSLPAHAEPWRIAPRDEAIPVHAVGRYREAARVERAQRGPITFAGDYLTTATVDGAIRSGWVAADALLGD